MATRNPVTSRRAVEGAIYASKIQRGGYAVNHDIDGEAIVCEVPTIELANVIVYALRNHALAKRKARLALIDRQRGK